VAGDGLHAERGGQVRLAGAGAADQHDVLGLLGEGRAGELLDLAAIDLRLFELEAGQIAMHREARGVHLVADRAQAAIGRSAWTRWRSSHSVCCTSTLLMLQQFGIAAGHAVQAQRLEFGDEVSHGPPPHAGVVASVSAIGATATPAVATVAGGGPSRSRASTLSTCSALGRPDSSTSSTATSTASRPKCCGTAASTCAITRSPPSRAAAPGAGAAASPADSANGAPLRSAPGLRSISGT
jgi:hypothetical protein